MYFNIIIGVPIVSLTSDHLIIAVGKPYLSISCYSQADPYPNVSWITNKQYTEGKYSITSYDNGTGILTINNIELSDDGQYTCVASNVLGTANDTFMLSVQSEYYIHTATSFTHRLQYLLMLLFHHHILH